MLYRLNLYDFALVGFIQLFLASVLFLSPAWRFRGYRRGRGSRFSEVFLNARARSRLRWPPAGSCR